MDNVSFHERYAPALMMVNAGLCLMALRFAGIVISGGSPVTPEIYGPAVYAFPALWWSSIQMAASLLCFVALGKRWHILVVIGAVPNLILQSAFFGLSSMADQGTLLQTGTLFITMPICLATLYSGITGIKNG